MTGLPKPAYVSSGPHLSGYRVTIGYETLAEAQDAHAALCQPQALRAPAPSEPVAWLYETVSGTKTASVEPLSRINGDKAYGEPLYTTPPAPDADKLRIAVEALETIAGAEEQDWEKDPSLPPKYLPRWSAGQCRDISRQALAALQAEQGGA